MTACSVLFFGESGRVLEGGRTAPALFRDLNLDQIVGAITGGKEEYDLTPFFYAPLRDSDAIRFRHDVMRDLEAPRLLDAVKAFALNMRAVRDSLVQLEKRYDDRQKEWWFLEAVVRYGDAVADFLGELFAARCSSRGLVAFRDYLARYASTPPFISFVDEAKRLKEALAAIRYSVFIQGSRVEVCRDSERSDYGAEVEATFRRFRQSSAREYGFKFGESLEMNHVEAQILKGVARLYPETFSQLERFWAANENFLDPTIAAFDREVQFYVAFLDFIAPLKQAGLAFCYSRIRESHEEICSERGFDLALAAKLIDNGATPVCNDFYLREPERILIVSGPNQGGKTTFARSFGQLHYLASLGCPVPGSKAQLPLFDRIFTHFEREERMTTHRGKLEDDLVRIHAILDAATPRSIILINEIFSSTALRDAVFLSKKIAKRIIALDALCVWVTFLDELSSLSEKTVSMVSTVAPDNPAQRTFKLVRRPADGLAYAAALAEKFRLTYDMLRERLGS